MEGRNVLLAIVLSTIVLVFWATFFEAPIVEPQVAEKQVTKDENISSPSIDEGEKDIKNEKAIPDKSNNKNKGLTINLYFLCTIDKFLLCLSLS